MLITSCLYVITTRSVWHRYPFVKEWPGVSYAKVDKKKKHCSLFPFRFKNALITPTTEILWVISLSQKPSKTKETARWEPKNKG